MKSILFGEPQGSDDWRSRLGIPWIMVTDAKSLYDHLPKTISIPKEHQTMIDLMVANSVVDNTVVKIKWLPTTCVGGHLDEQHTNESDFPEILRDQKVLP